MKPLNLTIIGAGSSYSPELIEKLAAMQDRLPVRQLVMMDIHAERLATVAGFCRRYAQHLGLDISIKETTDRVEAIRDAHYIITQLRVGGNAARVNDEQIPAKYGLVGQETTGAGGFAKALRTIPVMVDIARDVEKYNPDAWIINYTNPAGIISEAIQTYTNAKIAGLCAGGLLPAMYIQQALGGSMERIRYDYFGLNHLNFAYNITLDGQAMSSDEMARAAEKVGAVDAELIQKLNMIPSPYLQYYFHRQRSVDHLAAQEATRGQQVQALEKELFQAYADPNQFDRPEGLSKRGGGGYSDVAIGIIEAFHNNMDKWMVVNVPNRGTISILPDDAVIETGCLVNASGIHPTTLHDIPSNMWGLISCVKNYEQLTVRAAMTGDRDTALWALTTHPLVGDYDVARPLLENILEANQAYLPLFCK